MKNAIKILNTQYHLMRSYALPFLVFLLTSSALYIFYSLFKSEPIWINWLPAAGNAYSFCEMNRWGTAFIQPINTWSNLGYLFVGIICLTMGINDFRFPHKHFPNLIVKYPVFSILIGLSTIYTFIGSFFYHASLTRAFQKMDLTGMYFLALSFLGYNIFRLLPVVNGKYRVRSSHKLIVHVAIILMFLFFVSFWKANVNVLFPIIALITFIVCFIYVITHKQDRKIVNHLSQISFLSLLLGSIIWMADRQDILCNPDSLFQGHAVWHLLCAASILALYFHYRSDNYTNEKYKNIVTHLHKNKVIRK